MDHVQPSTPLEGTDGAPKEGSGNFESRATQAAGARDDAGGVNIKEFELDNDGIEGARPSVSGKSMHVHADCGGVEVDQVKPPVRGPPLQRQPMQPGDVYVGRGDTRRGLGPSKWGNPFKISKKRTREQAVAEYARHLRESESLTKSLGELRADD